MSNQRVRTSWRQKLHAFTGDREEEGLALAVSVNEMVAADASLPDSLDGTEVEAAARRAVADAHGDTGTSAGDESRTGLAEPTEVIDAIVAGHDDLHDDLHDGLHDGPHDGTAS